MLGPHSTEDDDNVAEWIVPYLFPSRWDRLKCWLGFHRWKVVDAEENRWLCFDCGEKRHALED